MRTLKGACITLVSSVRTSPARLIGIGAMSAAILMAELGLTRLLSVTTWYHFAFFAISLALLGLGASGVFVYLTPRLHATERLPTLFVAYAVGFQLLTLLLMVLYLLTPIGAAAMGTNVGLLILAYVVGVAPFFVGGAFLSLAIASLHRDVNRVYGADLVGAGVGCLLLIPALEVLGGPGAFLSAATLGGLAGLLFADRPRLRQAVAAIVVVAGILLAAQATGTVIDVRFAKGEEVPTPLFSSWNSYSRVAVYDIPHMDWGLSRKVETSAVPSLTMNIDESASTPILTPTSADSVDYLRYDVSALAYWLLPPDAEVLVIGPGGGRDLWTGLAFQAKQVTGVEINSIIVEDVMDDRFLDASAAIYRRPEVSIFVDDGRNFIARSAQRYDLIQASLVDTWAASSAGAFALTESNLYTVEAFVEYLEHLRPKGVLTISRWKPDALRLVSLARAAGDRLGWSGVADRMFIAASEDNGATPSLTTIILAPSPLTTAEVGILTDMSVSLGFEILYSPGFGAGPTGAPDLRALAIAPHPETIYRASTTDISPVTDDRPFFFQGFKLTSLSGVFDRLFAGATGGVEVLLRLMAVSALFVLLLIVVPLRFGVRPVSESARVPGAGLAFFGLLGLGFIVMEIGLIQRFVLFLGHPVYALTVVLFTFLVGAGLGSMLSRGVTRTRGIAALALMTVAGIGFVYAAVLPDLLGAGLGLGRPARIAVAVLLLLPLAVAMGMPLPAGVRLLAARRPSFVAWAWGINGATSVLGSAVAVLVAVGLGFTAVTILASLCYLGAMVLLGVDRSPPPSQDPEPALALHEVGVR